MCPFGVNSLIIKVNLRYYNLKPTLSLLIDMLLKTLKVEVNLINLFYKSFESKQRVWLNRISRGHHNILLHQFKLNWKSYYEISLFISNLLLWESFFLTLKNLFLNGGGLLIVHAIQKWTLVHTSIPIPRPLIWLACRSFIKHHVDFECGKKFNKFFCL